MSAPLKHTGLGTQQPMPQIKKPYHQKIKQKR